MKRTSYTTSCHITKDIMNSGHQFNDNKIHEQINLILELIYEYNKQTVPQTLKREDFINFMLTCSQLYGAYIHIMNFNWTFTSDMLKKKFNYEVMKIKKPLTHFKRLQVKPYAIEFGFINPTAILDFKELEIIETHDLETFNKMVRILSNCNDCNYSKLKIINIT